MSMTEKYKCNYYKKILFLCSITTTNEDNKPFETYLENLQENIASARDCTLLFLVHMG
jgi:hypothetical protein